MESWIDFFLSTWQTASPVDYLRLILVIVLIGWGIGFCTSKTAGY